MFLCLLLQFSQNKHQRVIITSEDSKVRVLDGVELVQKFRGILGFTFAVQNDYNVQTHQS